MPDQPQSGDAKKKSEGWNIRPFDKDLRIACQIQATKEDMYDYEWIEKTLRNALGLPPKPQVLNSTHEGVKTKVRSDPRENAQGGPREARRSKTQSKA